MNAQSPTKKTKMIQQQAAQARQIAYMILSRLYKETITPEIRPYLDAIPSPPPAEPGVAYQQLFGFDVFPHASIFLSDSSLIGGDVAGNMIAAYQQNGFQWQGDADHISEGLQLMAFLCAAEQDAWRDNLPAIAAQMRQRQTAFLQTHLLPWLPPFVIALRQHSEGFYHDVATMTWELVVADGQAVNAAVTTIEMPPPPLPPALDASDTSLKMIVQFLTLPIASGWWLSARQMGEIGRALDLPRGFGGRVQTMMNLFRSATQYDQVDALLLALHDLASVWQAAYSDMPPEMVRPWQTRIAQTIVLLETMKQIKP